jgi:hypothetical protein
MLQAQEQHASAQAGLIEQQQSADAQGTSSLFGGLGKLLGGLVGGGGAAAAGGAAAGGSSLGGIISGVIGGIASLF